MAPTLPIDLSNFPAFQTRKALLIIDLQNEFLSSGGSLHVSEPKGYLERGLDVAKKFRESGAGDVFWIHSQFDAHRPTANVHIITSATPPLAGRQTTAVSGDRQMGRKGRKGQKPPGDAEPNQDADPEAFLSIADTAAPAGSSAVQTLQSHPMLPGSFGSELAPQVAAAVDARQDLVIAKSHYSAFESTKLLTYLRTRFIMELYIFGALTNISIYATALDAARHGLTLTIVEDCCGYRDAMRHSNALQSLVHLTGCETVLADRVLALLPAASTRPHQSSTAGLSSPQPPPANNFAAAIAAIMASSQGPPGSRRAGSGIGSEGPGLPVRAKTTQKVSPSSSAASSTAPPLPPAAESKPRIASPAVGVEKKDTIAASGPTRVPPTPAENTAGEIAPGDGDNASEDESGPRDSSTTELSSRSAKILEYSRLRAKLQADVQRKQQQQQQQDAGGEQNLSKSETVVPVDTTKKPASTGPICAGDTIIYYNVLPAALENGIYERLRDEVHWQRMSHQGGEVPRLVCVQGGVDKSNKGSSGDANDDDDYDDAIPVYRHPADKLPPLECFTPTVQEIKQHIESIVGHPLNHALIQHYRDGNDYISEHSDKTLDIVPGSYVCNLSLGAERTMVFRTKKLDKDPKDPKDDEVAAAKRQSCRVQLPHNSLCRMGLETNKKWLHAIRQDKRADRDKSEPEMAFDGGRISLTFRRIGTFLNKSETLIWGQGAVAKTRAEARPVINGQSDEAVSMLRAFGTENHSPSFDWARCYGHGFDVLHMSSAPRFFASTDDLVDTPIQLFLAELGINYARGSLGSGSSSSSSSSDTESVGSKAKPVAGDEDAVKAAKEDKTNAARAQSSLEAAVRFVDNDRERSTVHGLLAILLYLDSKYGAGGSSAGANSSSSTPIARRNNLETAQVYTRLQRAILLQDSWRSASCTGPVSSLKPWKSGLMAWNAFVSPKPHTDKTDKDGTADELPADEVLFIAGGSSPSVADYAFWPVLHGMEQAYATACRDTSSSGSKSTFAAELERLGMPSLARYYVQLKARASFERVMLAGEK